jgi:copper transport protein
VAEGSPVIRRTPRLAAAVLLTILVAAASEGAHAHAVLVESTPADGAALDRAPERVTLRFNEPVRVISLRLVDDSGRAMPLAQDPKTTPDRVEAPLPSLSPGSYVVSWRLLSLDGHPVGGAAFFTLGAAQRHADPGAMVRAAEPPAGLRMAHLVIRALTYACALLASGLALFLVLFGRYTAVNARAVARLAVAAALLGAVATATGAAVQSAMLAAGLADALDPTALASVLGSGFGLGALVRTGGLVVLLVALAQRHFVPVLGAAGALAVAASFALTGHTVRLDSPALSALLVFHLLAVAFWTGSFIPLVGATRGTDVAATQELMRAFSAIAVVLVPGLIAAGAAIAWFLVGEWPALVATPYGVALSAKSTLVAGMLALAAVNKWRLVPALPTGRAAVARLRRSIFLEAALALAVIVATTALTSVPPPTGGQGISDGPGRHTVSARTGSFDLLLSVVPARAGTNTLDLAVTSGGDPKDVMEVTVHLGRPDLGIEEITRLMQHVGPGRYRLQGPELAVAGPWRLRIDLLVSDFEKQSAEVLVTIGAASDTHLH